MIYSGLDWSGSPGLDQGPWIVFVAVHVDVFDMPTIHTAMAGARYALGRRPSFPFRHVEASPDVHAHFYEAIGRTRFRAHAYMLHKESWALEQSGRWRWADSISDGVINLVLGFPDAVMNDQV